MNWKNYFKILWQITRNRKSSTVFVLTEGKKRDIGIFAGDRINILLEYACEMYNDYKMTTLIKKSVNDAFNNKN